MNMNQEIEHQTGVTGEQIVNLKTLEAGMFFKKEEQVEVVAEMLKQEKDLTEQEVDEVLTRCAMFCILSRESREMKISSSWGDESIREEKKKDEKFVVMSEKDWWNAKEVAKRQHWFKSWEDWKDWKDRVQRERDSRKNNIVVIKREKDMVEKLLDERRDVMRYPTCHVSSEESYHQLIEDIEATVRSLPGGKWRLEMEYERERPKLQIRINEVVNQVKALYSLKKNIAATIIQNAWRTHNNVDMNSILEKMNNLII